MTPLTSPRYRSLLASVVFFFCRLSLTKADVLLHLTTLCRRLHGNCRLITLLEHLQRAEKAQGFPGLWSLLPRVPGLSGPKETWLLPANSQQAGRARKVTSSVDWPPLKRAIKLLCPTAAHVVQQSIDCNRPPPPHPPHPPPKSGTIMDQYLQVHANVVLAIMRCSAGYARLEPRSKFVCNRCRKVVLKG